jgi:hypothetical protein
MPPFSEVKMEALLPIRPTSIIVMKRDKYCLTDRFIGGWLCTDLRT